MERSIHENLADPITSSFRAERGIPLRLPKKEGGIPRLLPLGGIRQLKDRQLYKSWYRLVLGGMEK